MISKLTNFSHKSFKAYTNPNDLLFCEKNIVFAYNGKGKSSFAIGVRTELLKDRLKSDNNMRLFNKEYITESLLLKDSAGKLKGIEANFSKKDVEAENKIKKLESEIVSEADMVILKSEIEKNRESARREIDSIHDKKKGKVNIQKKTSSEKVEKVIELYEKDYVEAKKIENSDEALCKISGDDAIEKQIRQFDTLNQLTFSEISKVEELKSIFNEKFGEDIEIPEYKIMQWVEEGLEIHQEDNKCIFCGGKPDYLKIKTKIQQWKENKKHKAIEIIKSFKEQLQKSQKEIELIENTSKTYISIVGNSVEKDFQSIINSKRHVENLVIILQCKIDKIESEVVFDFEELESISSTIRTSISTIKAEKDKQVTELRKKQNNIEVLVKGAIGLEVKNSQPIKDKLQEIEKKESELKTKQDANKDKLQEVQNLKQQKSITKDFADFVSLILKDINISLRVEVDVDNRNYIIKNSHENIPLTINDISEGEKNLLALLFFYYELFNDNEQKQAKAEIELIVVDDPISSMDDSNKFYILELMKNLLNLSNQQIFVLTHSWDDFCNLSYGKKAWDNNSKYATFEIRKDNSKSDLAKLTNLEKPYKYLFKEIYAFSQKQENQIGSDCEVFHYPNVMRRIFEEWYNFKIGKDLSVTSSLQDRLENDLNIASNDQKTKLGMLLKVCNILSHSINNSKNPQEIHQSARFLMKLIEDNDKLHFSNMKA